MLSLPNHPTAAPYEMSAIRLSANPSLYFLKCDRYLDGQLFGTEQAHHWWARL
jgi:hypothetical protein